MVMFGMVACREGGVVWDKQAHTIGYSCGARRGDHERHSAEIGLWGCSRLESRRFLEGILQGFLVEGGVLRRLWSGPLRAFRLGGAFKRPLTLTLLRSSAKNTAMRIVIQVGGVFILSAKKRACFCKSIAIEMGGLLFIAIPFKKGLM